MKDEDLELPENPVKITDSIEAADLLRWVYYWLKPGDSTEERDQLARIKEIVLRHKRALRPHIEPSHSKFDEPMTQPIKQPIKQKRKQTGGKK